MYVYYNGGMILITDTENTTLKPPRLTYTTLSQLKRAIQTLTPVWLWGLWVPGGFAAGQYVHGAYADGFK